MGGELQYEHLNGDSYHIMLTLYGDCSSSSSAFQGLYSSQPWVMMKQKNNGVYQLYDSVALSAISPIGEEITPLCPSELSNSSCSGGNLPGIRKFRYETTVTLPSPTQNAYTEWSFEFWGNQNNNPGYLAGRSTLITNIPYTGGGVTLLNLKAYLNRSMGPNNSPSFTSIPAPFFCINKPQIFNIGAVDPDGNSLSYHLIPGLSNNAQTNVTYINGLSATNPLQVSANTLNFNSTSGQLNFTPNAVQNSIVVYEIREYKNGQLIGTSMREMSFVVLNNCNNDAPVSTASSTNSNVTVAGQDIYVCSGTSLNFDLSISDPNQNLVSVDVINLPPGMTANITGSGTTLPTVNIMWSQAVGGTYVIYVNLLDDGCPLAVRQTVAYTIHVVELAEPEVVVTEPTHCVGKAEVQYSFPNLADYAPIHVEVKDATTGVIVQYYSNISSSITDSLPIGTYTIQSESVLTGCLSPNFQFEVVDSGDFPFPPDVLSPVKYCQYDLAAPLSASNSSAFIPTTIYYTSPNGNTSSTIPVPNTNTTGLFTYTVNQKYKTCFSDDVDIDVYVTNPPGNAMNLPAEICQYDTLVLKYSGPYVDSNGIEIDWSLTGALVIDSGTTFDEVTITFPTSGIFVMGISAISEHDCAGNANMQSIEVLPSAFVQLLGDTQACTFEDLLISNTAVNYPNSTYTWNYPSDAVVSTENSSNLRLRFTTPGLKTISLSASNTDCSYTSEINIMVHPKPELDLDWDQSKVCYGDTVIIRSSPGAELEFYPSIGIQRDRDSSHIYYAKIFQALDVDVIAISDKGCRDTANLVIDDIKDCCKFFFPNAFTPNNDGINDRYEVWFEGNPKFFDMQIFNRYGERVFSTLSQYNSWDGRYNNKEVDMGNYIYLFQGECYEKEGQIIEKGDISLIR